ncbi:MAG: hypothetical protein IPI58_01310 [Alphaproteobacteria bacterium]|nr:MAG: hypothetical protein IPI58_01310 [Alphaproteobacteria bacterium]
MTETDMPTHREIKDPETIRQIFEWQLETFRSAITSGQNAVKSAFLLNGGAAVALLAFLGQKGASPAVVDALLPFAWGVFLAAFTSGTIYATQYLNANLAFDKHLPQDQKTACIKLLIGKICNILSVILCLASYVVFMLGVYAVHCALDG